MSDITWKNERRKISDLKDHSKNPRRLSKDDAFQLQNSF